MITRILPIAALSIVLAACDGSPQEPEGGENLSLEEVAERAQGADIRPDPGQYRVAMEVLELDIPGAPPEAAEMMRGMMAGQTQNYCLKQADVDKGFEEMARQGQDDSCTFGRFDVDGGNIDAQMSCDIPGQGAMTMTMNGTASSTSSVMDMTMQGNMGGMGEATVRMRATHERVGDCE